MIGRLRVIGIGPGAPNQVTPEAAAALAEAQALYGYGQRRRGLRGDLVCSPGTDPYDGDASAHGAFSQPGTNTIAK